jgi:hypothetical protein
VESKQVAEAEAFFVSDMVETKQAAEAEAFFISDSVWQLNFSLFLKNCKKLHADCVKYIRYL